MGIRTFTFNGESSDTYGVLITQNASFNAPERAGEMVSIPGRNGAYWHDLGRFENIEVTYKCAIGEGTKADFVQAMSDLRSWLCSPIGYCRLEDDYNPNEYRMAVYKSGLETDEPFVTGAEFDIVFECKPQRFLKSGESAISVTSGDTITNPTLFEAKPLLAVSGYGNLQVGNSEVSIINVPIGNIVLNSGGNTSYVAGGGTQATLYNLAGVSELETGDTITVSGTKITWQHTLPASQSGNITEATVTNETNCTATTQFSGKTLTVTITINDEIFTNGTSSGGTYTHIQVEGKYGTGNLFTLTRNATIKYDGVSQVSVEANASSGNNVNISMQPIIGDSTKSSLPAVIYLDFDIGEAYFLDSDDNVVSLNSVVTIPAELPALGAGATTVTYDNTFTSFDVVPRWWQV